MSFPPALRLLMNRKSPLDVWGELKLTTLENRFIRMRESHSFLLEISVPLSGPHFVAERDVGCLRLL